MRTYRSGSDNTVAITVWLFVLSLAIVNLSRRVVFSTATDPSTQAITANRPLVMINGQIRQLPSDNALDIGAGVIGHAGNPNGTISASIGSLLIDTSTPAVWQNVDGAVAWSAVASGQTIATATGIYGDCSDGDVIITETTTTLDRTMYYRNLTLASGVTINAYYPIYVCGTLTFSPGSSIRHDGFPGNDGLQNGIFPGGGGGAILKFLPGASAGGQPTSTNGGAGGQSLNAGPASFLAGTGGKGGNGINFGTGTTTNGGNGGLMSQSADENGGMQDWYHMTIATYGRLTAVTACGTGGGAGGSTGGTGEGTGGGGGGGGGYVVVIARIVAGSGGTISANGGNGGNGYTGSGAGVTGGGGGGGGGYAFLLEGSVAPGSTNPLVEALGGIGGDGGNPGQDGNPGRAEIIQGYL